MKRCNRCELHKDPSEFYKRNAAKDGLQHWCKQCQRAAVDSRRHTPEGRAMRQRYQATHRQQLQAASTRWLQQHKRPYNYKNFTPERRARVKLRNQIYRKAHPVEYALYNMVWYHRHRERLCAEARAKYLLKKEQKTHEPV